MVRDDAQGMADGSVRAADPANGLPAIQREALLNFAAAAHGYRGHGKRISDHLTPDKYRCD